jgi:thiol-disulfide isomerase/thioredoxin
MRDSNAAAIIRAYGYCPPMVSTARVRAPELEGAGGFIGTAGHLTLAALRGRVVLLDFWTQSCINCVHVLAELRELERQFGDNLLVIGIHSPKFPHEHDHESVVRAVERLEITHPVLDDPELRTWGAYAVSAWPTLVLVDPEGYIAHQVSGEGHGGYLAQAIATLLDAHGAKGTLVRGPLPVEPGTPPLRTGLRYPGKVAHDPERGLLAVADTGHHRIVLLDAGGVLRDIIGSGEPTRQDGSFESAALQAPLGVTFWHGALWIADTGNHRLRRADLDARELHTVGGPLRSPWDVAPYADDILVIAMAGTHQLWGYDPRYERTGVVAGSGREGLIDGAAAHADLAQPSGVASLGRMLGFVDAETSALRVLAPADRGGVEVATVVGTGLFDWGDADGSIGEARLQHPTGIAALERGFVVADTYNHRLRVVHMETGLVRTLAGSAPGFRDGTGAEARFFEPGGIARIDRVLIVADTGNHALRRVDIETGAVTSLLPIGLEPPAAPARRLEPAVLAADAIVTLLVAVEPPAGTQLDMSSGAPVHLRVSADPPDTIEAPAPHAAAALPAAITVRTRAGSGTLRVEARAAFCDVEQGEGAACRLAESAFVLPFSLEPGGLARLTLE